MSEKYDIVCIGMALVDSIIKGFDPNPISASGYRAVSSTLSVGGEAVNEAMAAAKLGMRTGILCALGEDDAGDMVCGALSRSGADTGLMIRSKDHATPVTTMFVNDDGTRKSITNTAHRHNFHPENYLERFSGARAIILGSLFRAPFDDPEIILSVLKAAKANGTLVVADTKLPNFRVLGLEDLKEALPLIDFITPNEDEAKYYTGKTEPSEMADVFLSYGVKNVVIKLGGKGSYFKNAGEEFFLPPCKIEAVDATGAGDNFVAGLTCELLRDGSQFAAEPTVGQNGAGNGLATGQMTEQDGTGNGLATEPMTGQVSKDVVTETSGLISGRNMVEIMRFANACGAICTTAVGAGTALKSRQQVEKFLEEN